MSESKSYDLKSLAIDPCVVDYIADKVGMDAVTDIWWGNANGTPNTRRNFLWVSWLDAKENMKKLLRIDRMPSK